MRILPSGWRAALLAFALLAGPSFASADLTLTAELGLAGHIRTERCTFVRVTVRNTEGRYDGAVRLLIDNGAHSICVPLPIEGVSTKRLDIPFLMPCERFNAISASYVPSPDGDGAPVAGTEVVLQNPIIGNDDGRLAIVIGDAASPIAGRLKSAYDHVGTCVLLGDDSLPSHWSGLDAAEICVLAPSDAGRILPAQWEALRKWTRAGGHLVLPWNPQWFAAERANIAAILPASVESSREYNSTDPAIANPFLALGGHPLAPSPLLAASLSSRPDASIEVGTEAMPFAVSRPAGFGRVTMLAFDPTTHPFSAWAGMPDFWATILHLPPPPDPNAKLVPIPQGPGPRTDSELFSLLGRFIEARPVSFPLLMFFALVYLACLGPLQVWGVRRWKRGVLAVSVPATMAIFTVLAYLIAQKPFVVGMRVHTCSIVENASDGTASRGVLMVSLLAPSGGTHRIGAEGLDAVWGVDPRASGGFLGSALSTKAFPGEKGGISARLPVWSAAPLVAVWMEERPRGTAPGSAAEIARSPGERYETTRKIVPEELGGVLLFRQAGVHVVAPWTGIHPVQKPSVDWYGWKHDPNPDPDVSDPWVHSGYPDSLPATILAEDYPLSEGELEIRRMLHTLEGDRPDTFTGRATLPCWNLRHACMKESRSFVGGWSDREVAPLRVNGSSVEGEHHTYYRVEIPK